MNNENLRPFKPGQSGNPGGRPKSAHLRRAVREALENETMQASLVTCLVAHAKQGNMQAMKLLLSLAEGPLQDGPEAV